LRFNRISISNTLNNKYKIMSICISELVNKLVQVRMSKLDELSEEDKIKLLKILEKVN
jgi:hypothetical protein